MVPLSSIGSIPVHGPGAAAASRPSFGSALRAHGAAPPEIAAAPSPGWGRAALEHVEQARQRLDAVLAAAQRGQTFTPQELLAVQCQAYRYSQAVDIVSKVVEQGVQSVKQAIQTQV